MIQGVLFYPSYYEAIRDLPDEDRLKLYDSIMGYGLLGREPELPVHLKGYFALIRPTMDQTKARYLNAYQNGKKGGRPRKNKNQSGFNFENHKKEKEKEKEYDTEKEIDWERDTKGEPLNSDEEFERKRAIALAKWESYERR